MLHKGEQGAREAQIHSVREDEIAVSAKRIRSVLKKLREELPRGIERGLRGHLNAIDAECSLLLGESSDAVD